MSETARIFLLLGGALGLVGALLLAVGVVRLVRTRSWVRTAGELVLEVGLPTGPTYRWWDGTGTEHKRRSLVRSGPGTQMRALSGLLSSRPRQPVPVTVRYDPHAPHRGVLDAPSHRGAVFVVIGAPFLLVATVFVTLGAALSGTTPS